MFPSTICAPTLRWEPMIEGDTFWCPPTEAKTDLLAIRMRVSFLQQIRGGGGKPHEIMGGHRHTNTAKDDGRA